METEERKQSQPTADRQSQIEQLYIANYGFIKDAASDRRLLVADSDKIAAGVAKHLAQYDGPICEQAFQAWAAEIICPAVARLVQYCDLRNQHRKVVLKAIWSVVKGAIDLGGDEYVARELADEAWAWAFENLDSLLTPGEASTSTRLYVRARWTARGWK